MRNYERGELAKDILLAFLSVGAAVGLTFTFIAFPGLAYVFKLFNAKSGYDKSRVRQSIRSLERRGYIQVYKKNDKKYIKITPIGKHEAIRHCLISTRIPKQQKWDGLWRIVMFDIPEKNKKARDALRFTLQKLGLHQKQKSVFVYPYKCKKEIDFVANFFRIRTGITYATANYIEGEKDLLKKFKLR